jgi:DNA polymerase-3 subunit delta
MKYEDIIKDLKSKKYKAIYFLCGEEQYYIDVISDFFEHKFLAEEEKDFNLSVMYGRDVDAGTVLTASKRFPMMAEHQVVVVKEAQALTGMEILQSYVEKPLSSTILVICYKHKSIDKRSSFAKALKASKDVAFLETKKLYENQLPTFLHSMVKSKKRSIESKAIALMCESIGNDLCRLYNEMDKLFLNVPVSQQIMAAHVEKYIGISKDYNVFELNNALGKRDVLKVNKIVNYFEANSRDASLIFVISILYIYFTALLSYTFVKNKSDKPALARAMGISPYFLNDYLTALKFYNPSKIVSNIALLREFDLKAKGLGAGKVSSGDLLREMMYKLIH